MVDMGVQTGPVSDLSIGRGQCSKRSQRRTSRGDVVKNDNPWSGFALPVVNGTRSNSIRRSCGLVGGLSRVSHKETRAKRESNGRRRSGRRGRPLRFVHWKREMKFSVQDLEAAKHSFCEYLAMQCCCFFFRRRLGAVARVVPRRSWSGLLHSLSRLSRVKALHYVRQVCDFVDVSASTFSVAEVYSTVTVSDSGEPLCGFLCYFLAGLQSISHVFWSPSLCLLCLGTLLDLHCTGGWFPLASVGLCRFVPFLFAPSDLSLFGCALSNDAVDLCRTLLVGLVLRLSRFPSCFLCCFTLVLRSRGC